MRSGDEAVGLTLTAVGCLGTVGLFVVVFPAASLATVGQFAAAIVAAVLQVRHVSSSSFSLSSPSSLLGSPAAVIAAVLFVTGGSLPSSLL